MPGVTIRTMRARVSAPPEVAIVLPSPDTWTLDTLRATLDALRAYLPSHNVRDAVAIVRAESVKRYPRLMRAVRARGWEAQVYVPALNISKGDDYPRLNDPMLAAV